MDKGGVKPSVPGWLRHTLTSAISLVVGAVATYLTTSALDHQKLVEARMGNQKTAEIDSFLDSRKQMLPLVADVIANLESSKAMGSVASEKLIKNLETQYAALGPTSGYLAKADQPVATAYQTNLVILISQTRKINGPLDNLTFINTFHDAVTNGCKVSNGLRKSAGLPPDTIDPACGSGRTA